MSGVPDVAATGLPPRIVVGANGAYWRAFDDDGFYSMCPVSTDNDPVDVVAVYHRVVADDLPLQVVNIPEIKGLLAYLRDAHIRTPEGYSPEGWYRAVLAQAIIGLEGIIAALGEHRA